MSSVSVRFCGSVSAERRTGAAVSARARNSPAAAAARRGDSGHMLRVEDGQARLGLAPALAQVREHREPGAGDEHAAADPDPGDQGIEVPLEGDPARLRIEPAHDEVEVLAQRRADGHLARGILTGLVEVLARLEGADLAPVIEDGEPRPEELVVRRVAADDVLEAEREAAERHALAPRQDGDGVLLE